MLWIQTLARCVYSWSFWLRLRFLPELLKHKSAVLFKLAIGSSCKRHEEGWKGQRPRRERGLQDPHILQLTANVWSGRHTSVSVSLWESFLLRGAAWPEEKKNKFRQALPTVFTGRYGPIKQRGADRILVQSSQEEAGPPLQPFCCSVWIHPACQGW